jgi:phosphopantetheine adenylyltransferase
MNRGLLTKSQREFLRGEKDNVDETTYRYNLRSDFKQRMEMLEEDLELLEDAGEDDLVEDFYDAFGETIEQRRLDRVEAELEKLRAEMEDDE